MEFIKVVDVKQMTETEGLILQGCGGDPQELVNGINQILTEEGILLDGDMFKDISVFEHDGLTNLLFSMEDVKLNVGKLAMWRLKSHDTFGGTWLSDYIPNKLAGLEAEPQLPAPSREVIFKSNYIYTGSGNEIIVNTIEHPADRETILDTLNKAGVNGTEGRIFYIDRLECEIPELVDVMPEYVEMDEMNYLAVKIAGMNDSERKLFAAVIADQLHCESLSALINLTENLGCFELQPVNSPGEYGEFLHGVRRKDFATALGQIEKSVDPSFKALAKYIDQLEKLVDFNSYGLAHLDDGSEFKPFEYLVEDEDGYETIYLGPDDIPEKLLKDSTLRQEQPTKEENVPTDKPFYDVLVFSERFIPGLSLKIERNISLENERADISELVTLPASELEWRRVNSAALEQIAYNEILAVVPKWEEQAALTQYLDRALEYQKAPVSTHSSNQWGLNGVGHNSISNMTYKMIWNINEKTRYDREAGGMVPVAWHVTWNLYTNPPPTDKYSNAIQKIAGQENKPFTDESAAEKYLNGRVTAYAHLFSEISPPIMKEYAKAFMLNGLLLPGYTVAEEGVFDLRPPASKTSVLGQIAEARESKRQSKPGDRETLWPINQRNAGRIDKLHMK
jgi:hypothetical protein